MLVAVYSAFARSLEAIRASDHKRSPAGIVVAMILLAVWLGWLLLARIARYEVSERARLEVGQAPHRIAAPVQGQVADVNLVLGATVRDGDVLLAFDDRPLRLDLAEKRARLAGIGAQLGAIRREIAAHAQSAREIQQAGRTLIDEARARSREANATARFQTQEARRAEQLRTQGFLSDSEADRASAEAQSKGATADAQQLSAVRTDAERRSRESALMAALAGLERQAAALNGEQHALEAAVSVLLGEIERRTVRSPIDGRIGEVTMLGAGSFLKEGDLIATVVPSGELQVIAEFPLAAIGRLTPGQPARLRLDAFPWAEFGAVRATVLRIGTEAREGRVRVELTVQPDRPSRIPMQHGLSGMAIVEVEQVSPAILVLRAAGQLLRTPSEATERVR